MKVVHVAFECAPMYKTGGLGDVSGSLPIAEEKLGIEAYVVMPAYSFINPISKLPHSHVPVIYIKHSLFTEKIKKDRQTQAVGYALFASLTLEELKKRGIMPDILHCHDWHAALIPFLLKNHTDSYFAKTKTLITLHNIAYQGNFPVKLLHVEETKHIVSLFPSQTKNVSFLKEGIKASKYISTVSPNHAKEIRQGKIGFGLDKLASSRKKSFVGILNGIDESIWNTATDTLLYKKYTKDTIKIGKTSNKIALQKELGLLVESNVPLFGFVARLSTQKGMDLLLPLLELFPKLRIQLVILGTGDKQFEQVLKDLKHAYKDWVAVKLLFDEKLARRIYAASDFFLIPSHYEPCGLTQMISMRYGALPIASAVGGLVDSITDGSTGFLFKQVTQDGLHQAIVRALTVWEEASLYSKMQSFAMREDFSWEKSAKVYLKLYRRMGQ